MKRCLTYIKWWCTFKPNTYRLVHAWIESDTASWFTPVRIFLILPLDGRFGASGSRCCVRSWTRLSNLGVRLGSTLLLRSLWSNVHVLGATLFGFRQSLPTLSITFQLSLYKRWEEAKLLDHESLYKASYVVHAHFLHWSQHREIRHLRLHCSSSNHDACFPSLCSFPLIVDLSLPPAANQR